MQYGRMELWPRQEFCVNCDLGDMILSQGHDIPYGHGQKLCEILPKSDKGGKKLWPRQDINRWTTDR